MPKITPATGKTPKTARTQLDFDYVASYDSQIPAGWKHRNTKWNILRRACDTLLTGEHENVRIDVTKANGTDVDKAVNSIRAAVYSWFSDAEVEGVKVKTAKGITTSSKPFVVAWLEKVE